MLKKLSVHGFKSFCDRTEVVLGSGITAIVGPNGCGKSNLADALRWVLGEQNPRILRSARLPDIIFSGAETRKAMGMTEVRLLFDATGDGSETEIMRRLARDGSAECRLNGRACRWKDLVETLAGTGLSHTGYVVIGQGMIQELVSGRPEDRRAWIEEASGVARVRLDKRDMEAKLEAAGAGIARLEDLLVELATRKEGLHADKETAARYRDLLNQRKDLDLSMWVHQFDEESRRAGNLARRLDRYRADLRDVDLAVPRLREEEAALSARREPLDARIAELAAERESAARDLLALEKRRDAVRGQNVVLTREVEARTARRAAIRRDLENLAREESGLEVRSRGLSSKHEEALAALKAAEGERQSREANRRELGEKVIEVRTEVVILTGELGSRQRAREEFRRRLEDVRRGRAALSEYLEQAAQERERQARETAGLDEQTRTATGRAGRAGSSLESLEASAGDVKAALQKEASSERNLGARTSAIKARRKLLEDMERNFEGYGKGPRSILAARTKGLLTGIEGSVGELFSCEPRYIPALSAAIGGTAEDIIVSDEDAAKAAIAYLKETKGGRATFLPLSLLRPREMNPKAEAALERVKGVRPLITVVSRPCELEAAVQYLVGRVVLADTMDIALAFMRESAWTARVVTLPGESIEPGGAITGGEAPRSESLFRRKQELAEVREADAALSRELEAVLARRKTLEREDAALMQEMDRVRAETLKASAELSRLAEIRARAESEGRLLEAQAKERESQLPELEEREKRLLQEIERAVIREREVSAQMESRGETLRKYEAEMRDSLDRDRASEGDVRRLMGAREELARDLSSVTRRLEGLAGERVSHQRSLSEEEKEIARQSSLLADVLSEEKALGGRIGALDQKVAVLAGEVERAVAERDQLNARFSEVRAAIERFERDKASLAGRVEEIAAELESVDKALQDTADLIEQEFGLTNPASVEHPRIPRAEGLPQAEDLDARMKALGSVNLKAEEEYAEVSDRVDLLTTEKADVEAAIEEIGRARELVEKEIAARFVQTFNMVASSFREVFQDLFGGGKGDLTLIEDTLGIEVTAEPPGRRQKHLNLLSGGERSLCGIALIFAILSVRPSPLIVLDEVDTALDESNVAQFVQFLKRYAEDTQFLVITHQKATIEAADLLYGVTMEEPGVSKIFGMRLESR